MKSYTDLEQSRKLAEILPLESADMYYHYVTSVKNYYEDIPKVIQVNNHFVFFHNDIPCWSLAALIDIIPEGLIENYYVPNIQKENGKYTIAYGDEELLCKADTPVDACYEMIIKLNELKLL